MSDIAIVNARSHNLAGLSCRVPLGALTVVSGVSGSGKSTLAFDTLYAEGQRRYVTSLSTYARQFLERLPRPEVDLVSHLPPAIAIFIGATGPFLAPFFLRDDFEKENVIATKAACQTWLHLLKIPAFLSLGFDYRPHALLLVLLVGGVIVGTFVGRHLLGRISAERFLVAFQVVLALIALHLIATGVWAFVSEAR